MRKGQILEWSFPLPNAHAGVLLGNATLGAMVWGQGHVLCVTLNRADFWDHRGGVPWIDQMSYSQVLRLLADQDEAGLRVTFERPPVPPGQPSVPTVLPLGRIELDFGSGARVRRARLNTGTGDVVVELAMSGGAQPVFVTLHVLMDRPVLTIELGDGAPEPRVRCVTCWTYERVAAHLRKIGVSEAVPFDQDGLVGWCQSRPVDPTACVASRLSDRLLCVGVVYGEDDDRARRSASQLLDQTVGDHHNHLRRSRQWWTDYWTQVPSLDLPNPTLMELYQYGMFCFAGMTAPQGVPAGLQGPWVEEFQMVPWSDDYHFNINVQMCYAPAYACNRLAHLRPLLDMVWSWREKLRHHAKMFLGIDDGLMLPHSVDDRCTNMGGHWSGTIDHGCTAWVAKMMYDYWLYGGDGAGNDFLRDRAYPFMRGAMRVYQCMLEKRPDGAYALPLSVSPEYRANRIDSWGKNASFQLACIHWLIDALLNASRVLGVEPDPEWIQIQRGLPRACVEGEPGKQQVMLWSGTPLEESHRHHSHLAGITPFDVFDPLSESWRDITNRSIMHWVDRGMGWWSGWCMSWASQIHSRLDNGAMAELLLEIWNRVFANNGRGSMHNAQFPGFSRMGADGLYTWGWQPMQMDAAMGAVSAITDMLCHCRRGVVHIFPAIPARWPAAEFHGIRTEGGLLVSARQCDGMIEWVTVEGRPGQPVTLHNPWQASQARFEAGGVPQVLGGKSIQFTLPQSGRAELRPASEDGGRAAP